MRATDKAITGLRTNISDLSGNINKQERLLQGSAPQGEKDAAEKEIERMRPLLAAAQSSLKDGLENRATINKSLDTLGQQRAELKKQKAIPLKKAVGFESRLDAVRKRLDAAEPQVTKKRRRSGTVSYLASKYYELTRLEPEVAEDWSMARGLYEDYLAFPDIAEKPDTDEGKRIAFKALGDIYDHLAGTAATKEEARGYSANAVRYLQSTIARIPSNTGLLVSALAGESIVLNYLDVNSNIRWRIPVKRTASAPEFKRAVAELGPERLPKYPKEETQRQFLSGVASFQKEIADASESKITKIFATLQSAGFDPVYFSEHAVTQAEFLLALGMSYLRSGATENLPKAKRIALVVTSGRNPVENDGPEWWEAQTIQLAVFVSMAEQEASAGGDGSAQAKVHAKEADRVLATIKQFYPYIGGADRHEETLKEWIALKSRLDKVMGSLGLTPTIIDLEAAAPATAGGEPAALPTGTDEPGMAEEPPPAEPPTPPAAGPDKK